MRFIKLQDKHLFGAITNAHPAGMDFEEYRRLLDSQTRRLKKRLRYGFIMETKKQK